MKEQADFTIKNITGNPIDGQFEHLWPAVGQVWKTPYLIDGEDNSKIIPAAVRFFTPDGVQASIDKGIVYVVNASGKTVATYDFNNVPAPASA